jgi:diguanylate cyclase (GGDEF)-like protein
LDTAQPAAKRFEGVMTVLRLPGALAIAVRRAASSVRSWRVWALKEPLRSYVIAVSVVAVAAVGLAAADTRWQTRQTLIFIALLGCGTIAIEATRTVKEPQGTTVRDLQSIWYLAIAIILAPVFAFAAPIPLTAYKLFRTHPVVLYRRVFSNATISLAYGCASLLFHAIPSEVAGTRPGTQNHVLTWTAAVVACGVLGWVINHGLLLVAIKLSDPAANIRELIGSRESVTSDSIELSLAVSVALVVSINPGLMALALPSVIMQRRYLMRGQLVTNARIDAKTGLLNAATWQREATAELLRALRSGAPLALAMVDIDHFEDVNERAGHLVRDQLLRDIAGMLKDQLPQSDLIGRFGGEEFAILLPGTDQDGAKRISERLRDRIAAEPIAIESGTQAGFVFRLTVSIGVAALNESRRALAELIGAADTALLQAQSTGWNKVHVISDAASDQDRGEDQQGHLWFRRE